MANTFNDDNFEQEVIKSDIPVLVDFYADWCGPCKMMSPVVEQIAAEYAGKVKVGKINVDESQKTAQKYNVMSIPTFIVFKNGEATETLVGAVSKEALVEKIK